MPPAFRALASQPGALVGTAPPLLLRTALNALVDAEVRARLDTPLVTEPTDVTGAWLAALTGDPEFDAEAGRRARAGREARALAGQRHPARAGAHRIPAARPRPDRRRSARRRTGLAAAVSAPGGRRTEHAGHRQTGLALRRPRAAPLGRRAAGGAAHRARQGQQAVPADRGRAARRPPGRTDPRRRGRLRLPDQRRRPRRRRFRRVPARRVAQTGGVEPQAQRDQRGHRGRGQPQRRRRA